VSLVFLFSSPALASDENGLQKSGAIDEAIDVTEVQVPVTVAGKDGVPIRGLNLEDFQLSDNGRRQEILSLEEIDLEVLEPGRTRSQIENAVPAAARRYFLLLFDHSFSRPSSIRKAQEASRRFVVESLHPTDLAAVGVLTPETGPRLVVTFTPDRAQIARGIDVVASPDLVHLAQGRDPLRFLIQTTASMGGSVSSGDAPAIDEYFQSNNPQLQGYLEVIGQRMSNVERSFDRGQVEGWSASMTQLGRALNSLRGRKYVIYFSEGFDSQLLFGEATSGMSGPGRNLSPLEQSQAGVLDSEGSYGSGGVRSSVDEMLKEFRRADCVIEAIDISDAKSAGGSSPQGSQGSLFYLANETGGEVFSGRGGLEDQLEVMLRRSAVTYLLTFQPSRVKVDGSYHRLKVKADLPAGARLTHRSGYYAPRPFDMLHPVEKDLLVADAIAGATPSKDVAIEVLAAPFPANEAQAYVPVVLEIAGESLVVGHQGQHLPIEIYAYVSNEDGEMSDFFTHVLTFDLEGRREAFLQTGLKYYGHFDLNAGRDYLLRIVVRNGQTGRTGVETLVLDVPDYSTHEPVLLPPFFVEPPQRWFMVREQPPKELEREWIVYPFTINGEPFVPAVAPVMQPEEEIEICLIAYNLGVEEFELSGTVLAPDGQELEGGTFELTDTIIATKTGVNKMVVRFTPEGLKPGSYRLRLDLLDPSWGESTLQQVSFTVAN